ncbi:hypothetical protein ACFYNY_21590 [Streptomyces sp. NPDC006530]|uniref:hypothetical protein n=1 Tax=Streptomyces sp. NPDC006530 TaxID=3364750 RepID=UPI00367ABDF1
MVRRKVVAGALLLVGLGVVLGACQEAGGPVPVVVRGPAAGSAVPAHGCRLNRDGWAELPCVPERAANHRHTRGSCVRGRPGPHRCRRH